MLHSGRFQPYPLTLDKAGKACQTSLLWKSVNYGRERFIIQAPAGQNYNPCLTAVLCTNTTKNETSMAAQDGYFLV